MGRFITAGLGSVAHVGVSEGNTPVSSSTGTLSPTSRGNRRLSSKFPVPLRLGSGSNYEHESQSSSSTSASFTTLASSSTSATSLMLDKIIMIDALDECTDLPLVSLLIQLILKLASAIPLKVLIASRESRRLLIRRAFTSLPSLRSPNRDCLLFT